MAKEKKSEETKEQNDTDRYAEMIKESNEAAQRLEDANAKLEANLARQEELRVAATLAGQAQAGSEKKEEETPQEYAKRVMEGNL